MWPEDAGQVADRVAVAARTSDGRRSARERACPTNNSMCREILRRGSLRHLLASVSFVYFDGDLPAEMAHDIGLKTEVDSRSALSIWIAFGTCARPPHPKAAQALLRGFKEIQVSPGRWMIRKPS